jgi:hypothetical protein
MAQSKDSLLVYTAKMDSLCISVADYDYILVFDVYLCKDCVSPKIKQKKKILLIPLDNDVTYENRLSTKLSLKRDYPVSDCYFFNSEDKKKAIVQKYTKNQLIKITNLSSV